MQDGKNHIAIDTNSDDIEFEEYDGNSLIVDVDGYEGPLHLLLNLARTQKVDLARISILKLVNQYLDFITRAKRDRIEVAADYLVMAAWLAFLKSRLLLPKKEIPSDETPPEILSSHLAWRLKRLEAMRKAGDRVLSLTQTGVDVFIRGAPEIETSASNTIYEADFHDLLQAYCKQRNKFRKRVHRVSKMPVYGLEEARQHLKKNLPIDNRWHNIAEFAPKDLIREKDAPPAHSFYAGIFSASLELAKYGNVNLQQNKHFDDIFLRNQPENNKKES